MGGGFFLRFEKKYIHVYFFFTTFVRKTTEKKGE